MLTKCWLDGGILFSHQKIDESYCPVYVGWIHVILQWNILTELSQLSSAIELIYAVFIRIAHTEFRYKLNVENHVGCNATYQLKKKTMQYQSIQVHLTRTQRTFSKVL